MMPTIFNYGNEYLIRIVADTIKKFRNARPYVFSPIVSIISPPDEKTLSNVIIAGSAAGFPTEKPLT